MTAFERIKAYQPELEAIRHDLHMHPELGLEEHRTADIVARKLEEWGIEVHRGVGVTGVVGVLRSGNGAQSIGLRADMDALPMQEMTDLPYASTVPGKMHACGHDGHTTMLLGAARYLAETRNFNGTVNFIFQPGEEGCGGALAMLEDKLFERFPCDRIFGMHNHTGMAVGTFAVRNGPAMAGGAFFDITIGGKGSHGARPEGSIDPVLTACHIATALQSIVSRNLSPREQAVVSVTKVQGGDAYNVIPQTATISGTARFFSREVGQQIEEAMRRLSDGIATGFGATASVEWRLIFAPTVNTAEHVDSVIAAAKDLVGEERLTVGKPPVMGSEDFSFMLEKVPGAYLNVGNGEEGFSPHHPGYRFDDASIPYGSAMYARLVEMGMPKGVEG
ncbi:N-acyl-L-amino acid amidohydrolase [Roseomonas mucosa]|uniref:Amidohydrolase n=1 Tax=Roseomonas mucosa TaxID=207340 RepID=A0A1S8DA07_9PROT|nr:MULTISPECIES: M20 aminoacylase family protein [Roseomonas]MDU7522968.1 M20 aminoacylase family protein [Roseomonas mucosa]ONH84574.1 amidohydrolase [Roseomonas mucosa]QDJ10281.1 N-acyl-L-amino acid amidohydrolase [Roseomonas mucosa]GAV32789.1 putative hydrolase YxeP [Roseomonas sp. TAS13]